MKQNISTGMKQLQKRVAEKLIRGYKRDKRRRSEQFLLRMHPEFRLEVMREAQKAGRSQTYFILESVAMRMDWKERF